MPLPTPLRAVSRLQCEVGRSAIAGEVIERVRENKIEQQLHNSDRIFLNDLESYQLTNEISLWLASHNFALLNQRMSHTFSILPLDRSGCPCPYRVTK